MYLNLSTTLSACGDVIPSTSSTNELNISCVPLLVVVEVGGTKGKPIKDGEVVKLKLVNDATTVDVTAERQAVVNSKVLSLVAHYLVMSLQPNRLVSSLVAS